MTYKVHAHSTDGGVPGFTAGYFTFWVVLSLIWGLIATVIATLLPIWESREALISIVKHFGGKGGSPQKAHPPVNAEPDFKLGQVPTGTTAGDDSAHNSKFNV